MENGENKGAPSDAAPVEIIASSVECHANDTYRARKGMKPGDGVASMNTETVDRYCRQLDAREEEGTAPPR